MPEIDAEGLKKRQDELIGLFNRAPMKRTFGMELHYDENGSAIFDMPYNPDFNHTLGGIHGGVIATLLDNAGWFTVAPLYNTWISTAELQVRLLNAAVKVDLYSRGRILSAGKRIAMAEMEVRTRDDLLVAVGSGSFAVTSMSITKAGA